MTDKITEIFGKVDFDEFKDFNGKTNSTIEYNRKTDNVSRDFSWMPIVEETIPYLDNIIRNPRRFIQQEEDIVIVEKSKKISTETIEHLAQHTNYIQDIDKDGMIKPSKVLNVQKEETWDLYENRFIYTLIKELGRFIRKYTDRELEPPHKEINNVVTYNGESSYSNESIKVNVNIETKKTEEPESFNADEMADKIENLQNIIMDFENSQFIKSLSQAVPVKSPIRKTNIILKDTNFQRALALWEFLKNSEIGEPIDRSTLEENLTDESIKDKYDFSYYLDYISMNMNKNEKEISSELLADKLLSLLDEYIDTTDLTEKKLSQYLMSEIKSAVRKRKSKENEIYKIFNKFINDNNIFIKSICDLM